MIQSKAVLTVNAIAKKLSANDVLAFLHRVVVIDTGNSSVVYRNEPWFVAKDIVIDTGNSSVVYWNIQKFIVDGTVIDTWN